MLATISWISLLIAVLSALVIAIDEFRNPQQMWIMNIVWPVTALYFSIFAVVFYFRAGRRSSRRAMASMSKEEMQLHKQQTEEKARHDPSLRQVALATSHCGAGCVLADILVESGLFALGITLLGSELWASYLWDLIAAWLLGIIFQYFTIKPMRNLSVREGLLAAVKADTLSILAFQIGMYLWMALTWFKLFPHPHLHPNEPGYWLMMQIAMICGFLTSLPMNRLLIQKGWKEAMG